MSGRILGDRFKNADPVDITVAQFLGLAKAANINFIMMDDRLVMHSAHMNWQLWHTLRRCLDEIGVPAIADFLTRTTLEDRHALSAAASPCQGRILEGPRAPPAHVGAERHLPQKVSASARAQ